MLPRIIGHGRAAELLFTGRTMPGTQALDWGFYTDICEPDDVLARAQALAGELAHGPTAAHAMTKRMLHDEWATPLDAAIDAEARAQAFCMETEDFQRAYEAFVNKTKPVFEGN